MKSQCKDAMVWWIAIIVLENIREIFLYNPTYIFNIGSEQDYGILWKENLIIEGILSTSSHGKGKVNADRHVRISGFNPAMKFDRFLNWGKQWFLTCLCHVCSPVPLAVRSSSNHTSHACVIWNSIKSRLTAPTLMMNPHCYPVGLVHPLPHPAWELRLLEAFLGVAAICPLAPGKALTTSMGLLRSLPAILLVKIQAVPCQAFRSGRMWR